MVRSGESPDYHCNYGVTQSIHGQLSQDQIKNKTRNHKHVVQIIKKLRRQTTKYIGHRVHFYKVINAIGSRLNPATALTKAMIELN